MLVICAGCQREGTTLRRAPSYAVGLRYANPTYGVLYLYPLLNNARLPGKKIKTLDPRLQMSGMTE